MARLEGVTRGGGLLARVAFWLCKRKIGKVIQPVRIHALHSELLMGYGRMEQAQEKARSVDPRLKTLGGVLAAVRIGCPF